MNSQVVELITRKGCHLCDDALAMLHEAGITPTIIDIDQHQDLLEEFHEWVPVIKINGQVRFRGRVNRVMLLRTLAAAN